MRKNIICILFLLTLVPCAIADDSIVTIGDSVIRGAAAYGSRMDTAPNGWTPDFVSHSGTLAGELTSLSSIVTYNNAIGGDVSGVPGSNGALSNQPEGVRNRWARDGIGGTDNSLTDSPRPNKTLSTKPTVVIVDVGINDCAYNGSQYGGYSWTAETTEDNLYWMAQNASENDIYAIFLTIGPAAGYCSVTYQEEVNTWMKSNLSKVASVYDVWPTLEDPANPGYTKAEYAADNVHYNDAAWVALTPLIIQDNRRVLDSGSCTINNTVSGPPRLSSGNIIIPMTYPSCLRWTSATNPDTNEEYVETETSTAMEIERTGSFSSGDYNIRIVSGDLVYILRGVV